jgi:hypothetical protein
VTESATEVTWLTDAYGNKCSVEYFGSAEAAQKALDSLIKCKDCINCYSCYSCDSCKSCKSCYSCDSCKSCDSCYSCDSCKSCDSCYSCDSCKSCKSCYSCDSCDSCYSCDSCDSCDSCYSCKSCDSCKDDKREPIKIPVIPDIHKRVYEAVAQPGALDMSDWHTCNTAHCRAGWVVALAGSAGRELEKFHCTPLAAQLIYRASGYRINPARFYDSDKDAMADMKRLAETEPSPAEAHQ